MDDFNKKAARLAVSQCTQRNCEQELPLSSLRRDEKQKTLNPRYTTLTSFKDTSFDHKMHLVSPRIMPPKYISNTGLHHVQVYSSHLRKQAWHTPLQNVRLLHLEVKTSCTNEWFPALAASHAEGAQGRAISLILYYCLTDRLFFFTFM